jgi:hypothetical protein
MHGHRYIPNIEANKINENEAAWQKSWISNNSKISSDETRKTVFFVKHITSGGTVVN